MLLDDDVVTDREPEPGAFAGGLGREERIEHLLLHLEKNAGTVVTDPYFDLVPEVLGDSGNSWLVVAAICFDCPLRCGIETIRNQVEQDPRDLLRK